eukprot:TRINITY_DN3990_c0_g1_i4.p2 TRINITY_DN3990_c0_g1~~TRINITY_DN3990_c0_g1_i4.p2  ORF type:complete len:201 (+),score=-9.75 TRINITY_DN3990_c0_g1_i4:1295-1897(+)
MFRLSYSDNNMYFILLLVLLTKSNINPQIIVSIRINSISNQRSKQQLQRYYIHILSIIQIIMYNCAMQKLHNAKFFLLVSKEYTRLVIDDFLYKLQKPKDQIYLPQNQKNVFNFTNIYVTQQSGRINTIVFNFSQALLFSNNSNNTLLSTLNRLSPINIHPYIRNQLVKLIPKHVQQVSPPNSLIKVYAVAAECLSELRN